MKKYDHTFLFIRIETVVKINVERIFGVDPTEGQKPKDHRNRYIYTRVAHDTLANEHTYA